MMKNCTKIFHYKTQRNLDIAFTSGTNELGLNTARVHGLPEIIAMLLCMWNIPIFTKEVKMPKTVIIKFNPI
jgi:hypothetical protein